MSKTRSRFKPDDGFTPPTDEEVAAEETVEEEQESISEPDPIPEPEPTPEPEPVPEVPDEAQLVRFIQVDIDKRLVLCVEPGHPRDGWLMRVRGDEVVVPVILCHGLTFFADLVE